MQTADALIKIFGCKDDKDLADIFGRDKSVVSHWRKKGLPATIERRSLAIMRERGIVAELGERYAGETERDQIPEGSTAGITLDEAEKLLIRKIRKRGKAFIYRWLADLEEEEAEQNSSGSSKSTPGYQHN